MSALPTLPPMMLFDENASQSLHHPYFYAQPRPHADYFSTKHVGVAADLAVPVSPYSPPSQPSYPQHFSAPSFHQLFGEIRPSASPVSKPPTPPPLEDTGLLSNSDEHDFIDVDSPLSPSLTTSSSSSFGIPLTVCRRGSIDVQKRRKERSVIGVPCQICGKEYKNQLCLEKHMWEHDPNWEEVQKLNLSKHHSVQLLEAAHILTAMRTGV